LISSSEYNHMIENQALGGILERVRRLPPKDAAAMAARAVMRVLPTLAEIAPAAMQAWPGRAFGGTVGGLSRGSLICLVFYTFRACQCASIVNFDTPGVAYAAADLVNQVDAAYANLNAVGTAPLLTGRATAAAVACAATLTDAVDGIAVNYAYDTVDYACQAAIKSGGIGPFVLSLALDLDGLTRKADLSSLPLWLPAAGMPKFLESRWAALQTLMLRLDPDFEYWISWYEARLRGKPLAWGKTRNQIFGAMGRQSLASRLASPGVML
jgi:hypothetical protein